MPKVFDDQILKFSKSHKIDFHYFLRNGFWVLLRQISVVIFGFFTVYLFTNFVDQEIYGQYKYVLSVVAIMAIFSLQGSLSILVRSIAKGNDGNYQEILKLSRKFVLIGCGVVFIYGFYYWLSHSFAEAAIYFAVGVFLPFYFSYNIWTYFLQGKEKFDLLSKWACFQIFITFLATAFSIYFFKESAFILILTVILCASFFNFIYYRKSRKYVLNNKISQSDIDYGWYLNKIGFLAIIINHLDSLLVGEFLGYSILAIYSVALMLSEHTRNFAKLIYQLIFPKVSRLQNYRKVFNFSLLFKLCMILFFITLLAEIMIPFMMKLLFPASYQESIKLTQILFLALPFWFLNSMLIALVNTLKLKKTIFFVRSGAFILKIFLVVSFFLIFKNLYVLAYITVFIYSLIFLVLTISLNRFFKRNPSML